MSDSPKTRVALIGAGGWGRQHARVFSQHPDVDLVAVTGRSRERTEARAAEYGVHPYTDIAEMLERERPDLVSLCLPNEGHFDATLQVIRAGVPLLVEKPLVFDMAEADSLISEAEQRGLFFAINFNHRYARPVQMAKRAIADGQLGEVVFATWRFGGEGASAHPHANHIETQSHGYDMLDHLCGPNSSVAAQMTDMTGGGYRTLVLALGFASGAVGSLVGTYDSSYAYPDTHRLEVNGTSGRIVVEDTVRRYSYQAAGSETAEVWQAGYFIYTDRAFHRTLDTHLDDLLGAFRRGDPPPFHARAGRRALELAMAAIESFETGTRIAVPAPPQ
jgi:predicted dehydrogenase